MTTKALENGLKALINSKMDKDYECKISDESIKEDFFIKSYDNGETFTLYRGCDLEVGDVPLGYVIRSICNLHEGLTKNIKKNYYIGKWGGCVDLHVIDDLGLVPQMSRYIGSENRMDIYETSEGVVYGVMC